MFYSLSDSIISATVKDMFKLTKFLIDFRLGHTKLIIRLTDAATLICRFEKKNKIKIPILFFILLAATKFKAKH